MSFTALKTRFISYGASALLILVGSVAPNIAPAMAAVVASASGVLVDSNGAPLPRAQAHAYGGIQNDAYVTDNQGRFNISAGTTTTPLVFAYAGYGINAEPNIRVITSPVSLPGATDIGTVTMPPLDSVTVRVLDSNGFPVAGAKVSGPQGTTQLTASNWLDAGKPLNGTVTAESGYWDPYSITGSSGETTLKTPRFANGLPDLVVWYTDPATGTDLHTTIQQQPDASNTITAVLPPVASASGVLVDSNGAPLPRAQAHAYGGIQNDAYVTDDQGRFNISAGTTTTPLVFAYAGYGINAEPNIRVITSPVSLPGATDIGTVTMPPLDSVTVRVLDSNGFPVAGAKVSGPQGTTQLTASNWLDAGKPLNGTVTAESGYWDPYSITGSSGETTLKTPRFANGLPDLVVWYTDPATGTDLHTTIQQQPDASNTITAVLPPVASASGVLVDSNGAPLPRAQAHAYGGIQNDAYVTDDQGRFNISAGTTTTPLVFAYAGYGINAEPNIRVITSPVSLPGATDIGTVTMPPLDSVTVRVLDSNGFPVAGAKVSGPQGTTQLTASNWLDAGKPLNGTVTAESGYWDPYSITGSSGETTLKTPRFANGLPDLVVWYTDPATGTDLHTTIQQQPDASNTITAVLTSLDQSVPVLPRAVTFTDRDGEAQDSYTIPVIEGIDYFVGGELIAAGTYPGAGTVLVTSQAKPPFVLASGASTEWTATFSANDTSLSASLMSFARTSPAVANVGDVVAIDWETADVPATSVSFSYHDAMGRLIYAEWRNDAGARAGTAAMTIGPAWASGQLTLQSVTLRNANGGVTYYPDGSKYKAPSGLADPQPSNLDFTAADVTVTNPLDTSLSASLMSFARTSPAVANVGDVVAIDWETADVPATSVSFSYHDAMGRLIYAEWRNDAGARAGTAAMTIGPAWASGQLTLQSVTLRNANGGVTYYPDGSKYKAPSGLADPQPSNLDFTAADVTVTNPLDTSLSASLMSFARTSPAVANVGDVVAIDWETADVPATSVSFSYHDAMGRLIYAEWRNDAGARAGTAAMTIGPAWASGQLTLQSVTLRNANGGVTYYPDGSKYKAPSGLADPQPSNLDFTAADVTVTKFVYPAAVIFSDDEGLNDDTYTVPAMAGVDYLIHESIVAAGTYAGAGTVTVIAQAQPGYLLAPSAPVSWTTIFKDSPSGPVPAVSGTVKVGWTLTAVTGVWGPEPVALTYQWYRSETAIIGANASTYKLGGTDAGKTITVTVTGSKPGYTTSEKTSAPTNVVAYGSLTTAPVPTITGTTKVDSTLTAVPGIWGAAPVALAYQWNANGTPIPDATASTYHPLPSDAGKTLTVTVTGTKTGYTTVAKTSAPTPPITALPTLTAPVPAVSGTVKVGWTLTAVTGVWGPEPVALTYQWYRSETAIIGANASTYKLGGTDAGKTITVTVTGSKPGYTTSEKTSAPTNVVAYGSLTTAPVPTITGTTKVDSTLTAVPGIWGAAPVALAYQWNANGTPIPDATASTYHPLPSDAGKTLTVTVTGTKTGYTTVAKTSAPTPPITALPTLTAPVPAVSGTVKVGWTLTAVTGVWGPEPVALTYQWYRSETAIIGANASTFKLGGTDAGKTITVTVTGSKPGYTTSEKTSAPTNVVAYGSLTTAPVPTITGTTKVDSTLTAVPGIWGAAPVALAYQWNANGTPIPDATASTYHPLPSDAGKTLTVTVTGTKTGYTTVAKTSAPTPPIT